MDRVRHRGGQRGRGGGRDHVGRLFRISLATWANGLRLVGDDGITVDGLRARARAACNIGGLERWGWITVGDPAPGGGRPAGYGSHRGVTGGTVLRPTRAGAYARRLWPRAVAGTEQRWQARFGAGAVGALREALLPGDGRMPWAPPEVRGRMRGRWILSTQLSTPADRNDSIPATQACSPHSPSGQTCNAYLESLHQPAWGH